MDTHSEYVILNYFSMGTVVMKMCRNIMLYTIACLVKLCTHKRKADIYTKRSMFAEGCSVVTSEISLMASKSPIAMHVFVIPFYMLYEIYS
jgi:hypothetical protein